MGGYIVKRVLFAIPTLFVVSVGIFLMVRLLPGALDSGGYGLTAPPAWKR